MNTNPRRDEPLPAWLQLGAAGALAMLLCLGGCKKADQATPAAMNATATATSGTTPASDTATIDAAIANPGRLPGDSVQDEWRKPKEVLAFLGARPGMQVLDYFSAGGYNTELLSRIVGEHGQVIAYNNAPYLKFAKDEPQQRFGANRLPNVAQLTTPPGELTVTPASLDAALFVMSYHDLYWRPKDSPDWGVIDPAQSLSKLVAALKPGAVVVVVDHAARAGGDTSAIVEELHRIDPAVVRRDFEAAGLTFDGESTALRNENDDHSKPVFDPAIQHKTDRIIYRFRKA